VVDARPYGWMFWFTLKKLVGSYFGYKVKSDSVRERALLQRRHRPNVHFGMQKEDHRGSTISLV